MKRVWLGDQSRVTLFPNRLWARCHMPQNVHMTNNLIEAYHRTVNTKFTSRPKLKRSVQILHELEEDAFETKKELENTSSVSTIVPPSVLLKRSRGDGSGSSESQTKAAKKVRCDKDESRVETSQVVPSNGTQSTSTNNHVVAANTRMIIKPPIFGFGPNLMTNVPAYPWPMIPPLMFPSGHRLDG